MDIKNRYNIKLNKISNHLKEDIAVQLNLIRNDKLWTAEKVAEASKI